MRSEAASARAAAARWSELKYRLGSAAGRQLLEVLFATVRVEARLSEGYLALRRRNAPAVLLCWHGRLLPLSYYGRRDRLVTLISQSGDGEYISRLVEAWGYEVVRGSSTRGGDAALRTLMRHARRGRSIAISPDGPRGPREVLKTGALLLAQRTGLPVVPAAAGTTRGWWFEGWDRFLVPKPFARVQVVFGEPLALTTSPDAAALAADARRVEEALGAVMRAVDTPWDV